MSINNSQIDYFETTQLSLASKKSLYQLWNNEYPKAISFEDLEAFEFYLKGLKDLNHTLVKAKETDQILAWYFSFIRDDEKWFAIIIDSKWHQGGLGTDLINRAKGSESILNGWVIDHNQAFKIDGTAYRSPLAFYLKNGFKVKANERLETAKISAVKIRWHRT